LQFDTGTVVSTRIKYFQVFTFNWLLQMAVFALEKLNFLVLYMGRMSECQMTKKLNSPFKSVKWKKAIKIRERIKIILFLYYNRKKALLWSKWDFC